MAGQRQEVDHFLAAVPDLEHAIVLILAEGELVEFTSTPILRVRDGLIAEARHELDSGAILAQLRGRSARSQLTIHMGSIATSRACSQTR